MSPELIRLENLLSVLHDETELRRLFSRLGLGAHLPGLGIPFVDLVHAAVIVLDRHGRIDNQFFSLLEERAGTRAARVREIAAEFGMTALAPSPAATPDEATKAAIGPSEPTRDLWETNARSMSELPCWRRVQLVVGLFLNLTFSLGLVMGMSVLIARFTCGPGDDPASNVVGTSQPDASAPANGANTTMYTEHEDSTATDSVSSGAKPPDLPPTKGPDPKRKSWRPCNKGVVQALSNKLGLQPRLFVKIAGDGKIEYELRGADFTEATDARDAFKKLTGREPGELPCSTILEKR